MTSTPSLELSSRLGGVLVTDVVGSTRLRAELGDERAEPLRRAHERLLRAAVARHSGRVEKWLGDGILATFESVSSAARAAIDVQQANERRSRIPRNENPLAVRAGFSGGEILWRGGDCSGGAVDGATAACASASGGEILAPAAALELVGSREALRRRDAGNGYIAIAWDSPRSAAPSLGAPIFLRTGGQLPWTGRARAMSALREAYQRAARGQPQFVAIRGDAGIGKTRLVAELCHEIDALGGAIVYAAAHAESAAPYDPLDKALRHWVLRVDELSARLGPDSSDLARLVPELLERLPDLPLPTEADPEQERNVLHRAFGEWLRSAAFEDSFTLVLDSLHWASGAAYDLLGRGLEALAETRVLVVTTHRPSDARVEALAAAAERALGAGSSRILELSGLSAAEVEELVHRTRSEFSSELCGMMHVITHGNPLHLTELLRSDAHSSEQPSGLPTNLGDALRETVQSLDPQIYRVLEVASVIGEVFEAPLLAELVGDSEGTFVALERAARDGIVRELDRERLAYGFSHALMQLAFYDQIGGARAALLHERTGIALERRGGSLRRGGANALARHFALAAALGHNERAARYAAAAGREALAQFANVQALELFRSAERRYEGNAAGREQCELAIDIGEAMRRLGEPGYRAKLDVAADLAAQLGEGTLMARALLATYRGTFSRAMHVDEAQVERARRALVLLGETNPPLRARLLALLGIELTWTLDPSEGDGASEEALALARTLHDRELIADVLAQRQWSVFHPIAGRVESGRELGALAAQSPRLALRFEVAGSAFFTAGRLGDRAAAQEALTSMRLLAQELAEPHVRWMLSIREATAALTEARFADARAAIDAGFELGKRSGMPDADAQLRVQRFWLDVETQAPETARANLRALVGMRRSVSQLNGASLAYVCAELGLEAERDLTLAIIAPELARQRRGQTWLLHLCAAATAAARAGNLPLCDWLVETLSPHAHEHANFVFGTLGSVARYVALLAAALGQRERAQQNFELAIASNAAFGAVTWEARAALDLAELRFSFAGASDPEARARLEAVQDASQRLGLSALRERAERLRAHSLSP